VRVEISDVIGRFSHRFVEEGWEDSVEADGPNSPTTVDIVNRDRSVTVERIWPL